MNKNIKNTVAAAVITVSTLGLTGCKGKDNGITPEKLAKELTSHCKKEGGEYNPTSSDNGLAPLGTCFNERENTTFGYTDGEKTLSQEAFNESPWTLEGQNNPQYIASVDQRKENNKSKVSVGDIGTKFPSEIVPVGPNQYTALNVSVTENLRTGAVEYTIMGDLSFEGKTPENVSCGGIPLTEKSEGSLTYSVLEQTLIDNFDLISTNNGNSLDCERTTINADGAEVSSNTYGTMNITYNTTQPENPDVEITSEELTKTLIDETTQSDIGRDIGDLCVTVEATDGNMNSGIKSIEAKIVNGANSEEFVQMSKTSTPDEYCGPLTTFGGKSVYVSVTATNEFDLSTTTTSGLEDAIDKNDNIEITQSSIPSFDSNTGNRSLESSLLISDPEGDNYTISSTLVPTDNMSAGNYSTTICGNDEYSTDEFCFDAQYTIIQSNTAPTLTIGDVTIGGVEGETINPVSLSGAMCTDLEGAISLTPTSFNLPAAVNFFTPTIGNIDILCSDGNLSETKSVQYTSCPSGTNYSDENNGCI